MKTVNPYILRTILAVVYGGGAYGAQAYGSQQSPPSHTHHTMIVIGFAIGILCAVAALIIIVRVLRRHSQRNNELNQSQF